MLSTWETMKLFQEKMKESVVAVTIPGPARGRIRDTSVLARLTSSTMADSSISTGMLAKQLDMTHTTTGSTMSMCESTSAAYVSISFRRENRMYHGIRNEIPGRSRAT